VWFQLLLHLIVKSTWHICVNVSTVCWRNIGTMFMKRPKLRYCMSKLDLFMTSFANSAIIIARSNIHLASLTRASPSTSPNEWAFQKHFLASWSRLSLSYASPRATTIRESFGLQQNRQSTTSPDVKALTNNMHDAQKILCAKRKRTFYLCTVRVKYTHVTFFLLLFWWYYNAQSHSLHLLFLAV